MAFDTFFPITQWSKDYGKDVLGRDLVAAAIVTIMLIPQSLAYALLAGVPAEVGLYASILPLVVYALLGTSRTLSVGPVAIASLMTASALGSVGQQVQFDYLSAAVTLAFLSGGFLLLLGFLRLGFFANFLSYPVVSGFITASGFIIALSQLKHIFGISAHGDNVIDIVASMVQSANHIGFSHLFSSGRFYTVLLGGAALVYLLWARKGGVKLLISLGFKKNAAQVISKAAPIGAVFVSILATYLLQLDDKGVSVVGAVPAGLPKLMWPQFSVALIKELMLPAVLISIVGYVESISVGRTLGAKRQQKIQPNQELIALGAANIASSVSGAFPVTGGFSRSVVNFDAGAETQAASIYAAAGIAFVSLYLTPVFYYLPKATLAAIIVVAVISLIELSIFRKTWRFSKSDFYSVLITVALTLIAGVEAGVSCGVIASLGLHLYRTSKPHIAEVGLVVGTEHFRNVRRYKVQTIPELLSLRVDESLFFANSSYLEDLINTEIFNDDKISHVILMCSAVNEIDFSALETLEGINNRLLDQGVVLHFSEVKCPVLEALEQSNFLDHLSGNLYLSQYEAFIDIRKIIGL